MQPSLILSSKNSTFLRSRWMVLCCVSQKIQSGTSEAGILTLQAVLPTGLRRLSVRGAVVFQTPWGFVSISEVASPSPSFTMMLLTLCLLCAYCAGGGLSSLMLLGTNQCLQE